MNSTPDVKQNPSVRRLNRAYVDVPPSPLTSVVRRASGHVIPSNSRLKENAPLQQQALGTSPTSLKRKLVDHDSSLVVDAVIMPTKRAKSASPNSATLNKIQGTDAVMAKTVTSEVPDGFIYCHQCNRKRDSKHTVTCTAVFKYTNSAGKSKERTCRCKYCMQCLKNRYNENIGPYKSTSVFKCPRCRGICNCYRCRKLKDAGLTSNLGAVKSTDAKGLTGTITNENTKAKPKQLPLLKWQRIPLSLTQDEVDQRILIREFVFRFADCLEPPIAKIHMEDLEILTRSKTYEDEEDKGTFWVNNVCLRVIVMGLLGLLCKDCCDDDIGRLIKIAAKDLRAGGVNLNKIWAILSTLRDAVTKVVPASPSTSHGKVFWEFPDPLPPPASASTPRSLRSIRVPTDTINVVQSSQMIPVVVSLLQSALETQIIREEIDQGSKDNKDVLRNAAKEAIRVENERWEKENAAIGVAVKDKARQALNRDKRAAHKDQITNIENALKLVTSTFAPRFMPLGTDDNGRVYYALSPGVAEREAALEYLEVAASGMATKLKKMGRVLSVEERTEMRDWSWFVAVWGTKHPSLPHGAKPLDGQKMKTDEEDEEGTDDDEMAPKWWGFWDAEEITKLAEFISIASGIQDEVGSSSGRETPATGSSAFFTKRKQPRMEQLKKLTGSLREYATLLQWRARQDKFMLLK